MKASYLLTLSLAIGTPLSASAGYNCGSDYNDAVTNCDMPCPSMLGYSPGAEVNECPEHRPYCYKADNCPDVVVAEAAVEEVVVDEVPAVSNTTNTTEDATADEPELTEEMLEEIVATAEQSENVTEEVTLDEAAPEEAATEEEFAIESVEFDNEEDELPERVAEEEAAPEMMVMNSEPVEDPPTPSPAPTTALQKLVEERRDLPNPGNHFCAIGWNEATIECEENVDALACPPDENGAYMSCPTGTFCYGIASCVRATPSPTDEPTATPTTYAPTTEAPSSSPISPMDPVNFYFCGSDLDDANENCGTWCRYGTDGECPEGQTCQLESTCNATALNFTIDWDLPVVTGSPSATPTTYSPTVDDNPEDLYCFEGWPASNYDGPCGVPCPG